MSKELQALERIYCHLPQIDGDRFKQDKDIIETALKDYEKKTKLAKEYADVNNVAKRLKALEIIKSFVYFDIIEVQGQWYLIQGTSFDKSLKVPITKEQAKLLKEVLL